jgi:catechol 2,3-dioxygenase-like lactoylglutathione lyase family enzyme
MIKGLHHNAYRCRDSEETRRFYEDFLGLPLVSTLEIKETKSGRKTETLHTFYRLDDGSCLAAARVRPSLDKGEARDGGSLSG